MGRASSKRTPQLTQAQHQRVREQLGAIMKQIQAGQLPQAKSALAPLLSKHPALHEVSHVASGLYSALREHERALYYAQRALEQAPQFAQYHAALGVLLVQRDQHEQALPHLTRAIELDPAAHQPRVALGLAQMQLGQINQARDTLSQVLKKHPDDVEAANNLALLESDTAHASRAVEIIEAALAKIGEEPVLLDALCMFASYDDKLTPEQVFAIHERFGRCVQSRVRVPGRYPNAPDPDKRLRIGFVSPDLRTHSVAYFLEPIFEHLDHERFELCVYSTTSKPDEVTDRLRARADLWRDCARGIVETHKQISADRPDILIELAGHFAGNALPLFAARPAPVSVSMIGYGNTTGLPSITARLIDEITDPTPQADKLASERLLRLPGCFLCYRPSDDAPPIAEPEPGRPFTFGSFNDLRKISPSNLALWARVLGENPAARLVIKTGRLAHEQVRENLAAQLQALAVDPKRVSLLGRTPTTRDHLDLYHQIDCALDTFPYTGTTTTCEALHMGVPTITLLGDAHAGRVSASLLTAIGREDLIAADHDQYAALAKKHADQGPRAGAHRQQLRDALLASPLVDAPAYTRKIEHALRQLWRGWCAKNGGAP